MVNDKDISLSSHLSFCQCLKHRNDKFYFAIKYEKSIVGVINFNDIKTCAGGGNTNNKYSSLGYYFVNQPYKDFAKDSFYIISCIAHNMGIAYFDIFVKKSNAKGLHFAKDKLKAKYIKDDDIFSYFKLKVKVDTNKIKALQQSFNIKYDL